MTLARDVPSRLLRGPASALQTVTDWTRCARAQDGMLSACHSRTRVCLGLDIMMRV